MMSVEKTPAKSGKGEVARGDVEAFLTELEQLPAARPARRQGRLLFALDATMSRQPTWDRAMAIQADMFAAAASVGGLAIQIAFFRGQGEFKKSQWLEDGAELGRIMSRVSCRGGLTQIGRVLRHAAAEAAVSGVNALVFVGDAMEEGADALCGLAGELGLVGVRAFMFQEGSDPAVAATFQHIARLTGGAYAKFDEGSAAQLKALLSAVAVYAAGGRKALADRSADGDSAAQALLSQIGG